MPNDLLEAALDYARRGWPVFPLAERGKLPRIATAHPAGDSRRGICHGECGLVGHGLHDASTDIEKLTDWWTRWPAANIGLRTGVAFDVIDIDSTEALVALNAIRGDRPMTSGPSVATAHGWHLYHLPTGQGNRAGVVPGVDYRGAGGYVVAPPSVHPEGHVYAWGVFDSPEAELEEVPTWFVELLAPAPPEARVPGGVRPAVTADRYGRRALETELGRVLLAPVGGRNHQLNASAFALGQLVAGGVLDAEEVAGALLDAGARIGLSEAEAVQTIRSGLASGMRQPRGLPA